MEAVSTPDQTLQVPKRVWKNISILSRGEHAEVIQQGPMLESFFDLAER
jgi:hypothetical protein